MLCDAPQQPLQPPEWRMEAQGDGAASVMLGFVTFGTPEQVRRAGEAVEKQGLHCGIIKASGGRTELMVVFDKTTTKETAFSIYQRVATGEFGTSGTSYLVAPASVLDAKSD